MSLKTMESWVEEHGKNYVKSYEDAYSAVGTLCHEGIIGDSAEVSMPFEVDLQGVWAEVCHPRASKCLETTAPRQP